MRLQVLDPHVHYSCHSCGACCNQPWQTLIEPELAHALDKHDFKAYPQLAGKAYYHPSQNKKDPRYILAKGDGNRCLFLDDNQLCIIHKELGPQAKPRMCRQFPILPARTWTEDRVSANYGCPSVQEQNGPALSEQADDIAQVAPVSNLAVNPDAPVPLDATHKLTQAETDALMQRAVALFDDTRVTNIWGTFGELLSLLVGVRNRLLPSEEAKRNVLWNDLQSGGKLADSPDVPEITAFARPSDAPMPTRFLFAATLFPDTLPPDATASMGVVRRLTLIPKLMALSRMSGGYASRLLNRNVSISAVLNHEVAPDLPQDATRLLTRYYRSRLWQRFPAGTRLPILSGVHQHILDLDAILFLARAEALNRQLHELTESLIRDALNRVEFHLANQQRLHENTLKGWMRTQLQNPAIAWASLRFMCLAKSAAPVHS